MTNFKQATNLSILSDDEIESGNWDVILYINLENGDISRHCEHQSQRGSWPVSIHDGRAVRFSLPRDITESELDELLADVEEKIDSAVTGTTTCWDGSNYKGSQNDNAIAALEAIEYAIEQFACDRQY